MIARVWRGATLAENGDAYAAYLEETGMRGARELPGSRGTLVLRVPDERLEHARARAAAARVRRRRHPAHPPRAGSTVGADLR